MTALVPVPDPRNGGKPQEVRRFTITTLDVAHIPVEEERVRSDYVEQHWLPFIGPTAFLLARRIDFELQTRTQSALVVDAVATDLGVTPPEILAAMNRLVRFGLAQWNAKDTRLSLARHWPKVPAAINTPEHRAALLAIEDE